MANQNHLILVVKPKRVGCDSTIQATIWYKLDPIPFGVIVISVDIDNTLDMQLAVWKVTNPASPCPSFSTFSLVRANDDDGPDLSPFIACAPVGGAFTYFIQLDGHYSKQGTGNLQITSCIPPANDDLCSATPVPFMGSPLSVFFDNLAASDQLGEPTPPDGDCDSQYTWCDRGVELLAG